MGRRGSGVLTVSRRQGGRHAVGLWGPVARSRASGDAEFRVGHDGLEPQRAGRVTRGQNNIRASQNPSQYTLPPGTLAHGYQRPAAAYRPGEEGDFAGFGGGVGASLGDRRRPGR